MGGLQRPLRRPLCFKEQLILLACAATDTGPGMILGRLQESIPDWSVRTLVDPTSAGVLVAVFHGARGVKGGPIVWCTLTMEQRALPGKPTRRNFQVLAPSHKAI